ncbi:MAG: hypothetical protein QXM69_03020 [Sulfolobaceae archaeon]
MKMKFLLGFNTLDIIQRIIIAILSWFVIAFINNFIPQLSNYIIILQIISAISAFFFPFIVSPLLIVTYTFLNILQEFIKNITIYNFIIFLSYLIFWIITMFYGLIKYNGLRHVITTYSLVASQLGFSYLLYSGLGLKTDYKLGIFASLPFLPIFILSYLPSIPPIRNIIGIVLIFLSSYLFSIKGYYSIIGIVPIIITVYLINQNYLFIIPPLVINIILITTDLISDLNAKKRSINEQKIHNERIINMLMENMMLLERELKLISDFNLKEYQNKLLELLKQNATSNKLEELKDIEFKINSIKTEINSVINNFIFDLNNQYKKIFLELQNLGFSSQFEPLSEEIKIEDPSTFKIFSNNIQVINTIFVRTISEIEKFAKKMEMLIGTEIRKPTINRISELKDYIEYLKQLFSKSEIENCMNKAEFIIQTLIKTNPSLSKEISYLLIQYNTERVPVKKYEIVYELLEKVRRYIEEELKNAVIDLEELIHNYKLISLQENLKLLQPAISEGLKGSHCNVMSSLISLIDIINFTLEVRRDKESIVNIISTLSNLDNILENLIRAGSCINVKEFGLSQKYDWVVKDYLKSKGYNLTTVGEEICPSSS